jgi:hypothetical protein
MTRYITRFMSTLLLAIFISSQAFADSHSKILDSQIFQTDGASHYANGQISLSPWANSLMFKATLEDQGRSYRVEATLDPIGENQYRGSGKIYVMYDENYGCAHRFGIKIFVQDGQVYLRENTPRHLPYNPGEPCQVAGPYEWYNHPLPYVAQGQ